MKTLIVAALLAFVAPAFADEPKGPSITGVIVVEMDGAPQDFLFVSSDGQVAAYSTVACASSNVCVKAAEELEKEHRVLVLKLSSNSKT